jgi:phage terminase large subunit-like protein
MPVGGEKYGAWFDHEAADKAVAFFAKYIRHTEAEWFNKPFILQPWQENDIVRPIFGWKRADGTRLIRQVYIEIPRKNGKTELAAGLALLLMLGDGEYGGQGFSMAVNLEQASLVFAKAGVMVGLSEDLRRYLTVFKTSIFCPDLHASFKPLAKGAGSKHGFSPSFAIADELHEWPDGEIHRVVHKGTVARRQPLEILITTAGEPGNNYGWDRHEYAVKLLREEVDPNPAFYAVIYAADPTDDWRDPATWRKANPNYGVSVKEDYLRDELALISKPMEEGDFKRYHLNLWTDAIEEGFDMDVWAENALHPVTLETLRGRRCWGGLDLSTVTDLTALCLIAKREAGGYDAWWQFFMPIGNLKERMKKDRQPFDKWIKDGWITPIEGTRQEYNAVLATITGKKKHPAVKTPPITEIVELAELGYDTWNAEHVRQELEEDGVTTVEVSQLFKTLSGPSKEMQRLLAGKEFNHGGNPVMRWMASCTNFESDRNENIRPVKPNRKKTIKRIDGTVTAIMALSRAMVSKAPVLSPYEKREVRAFGG